MSVEAQAVHEVANAVEETGGIAALGINLKMFIAQFIHFAIVLLVFWKWVYGPIVKMLDKRAEIVEKSIKDAKDVEERVVKLEAERASVITTAKAEASHRIEEAQALGETKKNEILAEAKNQVESVVKAGKEQLVREKDAMIKEAKKEIAEIAVKAAEQILKESVSENVSKKMTEEAIGKLT
ncbi:MAG: ATP synthase subunit b [Candidatus Uhrbacteria bacterium GW2011_GWE2_45_35]|uniref:ATP synthase subunit b n=2 Tax=Candidatus Uhriibacteriota TaxID=1752732 RepID=A0A0G1LMP6_9BACT|nr:MAG: ATP synthase subunit b [Candidatus Uhrbacteria bacterium GW2011_GWF2_44_350]KKU06773.1 MAG: ATP synthase subunit b [Candidatus Uhrbacteria bacterium GW2011_GWE2_45_35]HBR80720.1 ATP synthase F0 subunit B [Candidatus Uhrbacteria bacterium]HCU31981.1 ATP synthase F0 subunit B [Candidatus Uhrbacteria bacterium]